MSLKNKIDMGWSGYYVAIGETFFKSRPTRPISPKLISISVCFPIYGTVY